MYTQPSIYIALMHSQRYREALFAVKPTKKLKGQEQGSIKEYLSVPLSCRKSLIGKVAEHA